MHKNLLGFSVESQMGRDLWCPPVPCSSFYSTKERQSTSVALLQVKKKNTTINNIPTDQTKKPTSRLKVYFNDSCPFLIEVAGKTTTKQGKKPFSMFLEMNLFNCILRNRDILFLTVTFEFPCLSVKQWWN